MASDLASDEDAAEVIIAGEGESDARPAGPDADRSVLVVEDDLVMSCALSRMLERFGYTPIVVHSARAARDQDPTSFAYALIDHLLPGPEGLELGYWLASLPHGIGVAVYSGAFTFELALNAQQRGILAVPRPNPAELAHLLDTLQMQRRIFRGPGNTGRSFSSQRGRSPNNKKASSGTRPRVRRSQGALPVTFSLRRDGLCVQRAVEPTVIGLRSAERRILTVLALARGEPVSVQTLGYRALGRTDAGAGQSVRQHISTLRSALGEYHRLVLTTDDGAYCVTHFVEVDPTQMILAG